MKIGIDIRNIGKQRTGDEAVFLNLVKNLALIDEKNKYWLFTDAADLATLDEIRKKLQIADKPNFRIISLTAKNRFVWNFWTLPNYLRKNPVHVYHTQYIAPFFVPRRIKIVTHIHDISFNFYPRLIKFSDLLFLKFLIPITLRRADRIIAVSDFTRQEITHYYKIDQNKIATVHNAVGDNFLQAAAPEKILAIKQKYAMPEKFILYVGTLQPRKNLPTLIAAFAELIKAHPETGLVLAGNCSAHNYDRGIDAAVKKHALEGKILFPGFVSESEKQALFAAATIFCLPSLYEGFGIPLLEAMRTDTALVISDIAAHREVAGNAALYFDPKRADVLTKQISRLLEDGGLRAELIAKGDSQAARFSWQASAQKMLYLYEHMPTHE